MIIVCVLGGGLYYNNHRVECAPSSLECKEG